MASGIVDVNDLVNREQPVKIKLSVVPWYNPEQFLKVYEYLYSQELTKTRWAVDEITVWDSRCRPSLPTAIEASLVLSRAIIQDVLFINEASLCHEKEIQMLYSMALVRFVNLSIELHQGNEKRYIAHIAQGLGIPSWIVDLRNEATHSKTPSLPVLRLGVEAAMKYLNETFWRLESVRMRSIVKEPLDIQKIKELILQYQLIQFKLFRQKNTDSELYRSDKEEIVQILQSLVQCLNQNREKFLKVLITDGFFVSNEQDLKLLLTNYELHDFYGTFYDKESEDEDYAYAQPMLPSILEKFWQPLLIKLSDFGAIPEFTEALLSVQGQRDPVGQRLIASWVIRILRFSMNPYLGNNALSKMFRKNGPLFNWDRLMFAAVFNPCMYTPFIFPLITCHLNLTQEFVRAIMNLMAITQGQAVNLDLKYHPKSQTTFSLDSLRQTIKSQDLSLKRKRKGEKERINMWSFAPDSIEFYNLPMGALFKSSEKEEGPVIERVYQIFYTNEIKYTWTLQLNKNDTKDMEGIVTVEQDTFEEEDEHILNRKDAYLYKKRTIR